MKLNCNRLGDWLRKRRVLRKSAAEVRAYNLDKALREWHDKFVIYRKIEHGDCRLFETVQRRRITVKYYVSDWFDTWTERRNEWEYRAK